MRKLLEQKKKNTMGTFSGILALAVPLRLPKPECLPLRLASAFLRVRALECTATGLRMIKPSLTNLRMFCPMFLKFYFLEFYYEK